MGLLYRKEDSITILYVYTWHYVGQYDVKYNNLRHKSESQNRLFLRQSTFHVTKVKMVHGHGRPQGAVQGGGALAP